MVCDDCVVICDICVGVFEFVDEGGFGVDPGFV
jgi:hypothetical protein